MLNTERFADTLALVANMGVAAEGVTSVSPQDNTPGHFVCDLKGCLRYEVLFKKGTATSANALVRGL